VKAAGDCRTRCARERTSAAAPRCFGFFAEIEGRGRGPTRQHPGPAGRQVKAAVDGQNIAAKDSKRRFSGAAAFESCACPSPASCSAPDSQTAKCLPAWRRTAFLAPLIWPDAGSQYRLWPPWPTGWRVVSRQTIWRSHTSEVPLSDRYNPITTCADPGWAWAAASHLARPRKQAPGALRPLPTQLARRSRRQPLPGFAQTRQRKMPRPPP